MNRVMKEEARKHQAAREGLSESELRELELYEARKRKLESRARNIHFELFPEEYDFMMDSISDAKDRRRGINPMSEEYTECANARRKELGVSPLGPNGMPVSKESWEVAYIEAERKLHPVTTGGNS